MIPIVRLKQSLEFNRNLGEIIDVLKLTAIIQFRQFQSLQAPSEEFLKGIRTCFNIISNYDIKHPFLKERPDLASCIIVVTSDEGFLGEFNTQLINAALDRKLRDDKLIVLGQMGRSYLEEIGTPFISFPLSMEENKAQEIEDLQVYVIRQYLKGSFARVVIIYAQFVSITFYQIKVEQLLPFPLQIVTDYTGHLFREELLIEPGLGRLLDGLVRLWLSAMFYQIFHSSRLSELAARIMHLEGSSEELSHINQDISFEYIKHLHSLSDKMIREITASGLLRRHLKE